MVDPVAEPQICAGAQWRVSLPTADGAQLTTLAPTLVPPRSHTAVVERGHPLSHVFRLDDHALRGEAAPTSSHLWTTADVRDCLPLQVSVQTQDPSFGLRFCNRVVDVIFFGDILLQFFLGYFDEHLHLMVSRTRRAR